VNRPAAVPAGPVLLSAPLRQLPLAAGRWLEHAYLKPMPFADYTDLADAGIVSGIYLVTDHLKRVRWLGQASRDDDLIARLGEHYADPAKASAFVTLRVLHLLDLTPPDTINAIEGRCADMLGLRGTMGVRRWPCADNWLERVSLRARIRCSPPIRMLAPDRADSAVPVSDAAGTSSRISASFADGTNPHATNPTSQSSAKSGKINGRHGRSRPATDRGSA
jgi:hypothetical protein